MNYFHLSWEEILWERSYANLVLLIDSIPRYGSNKKVNSEAEEIKNINDLRGLI